MTADATPINTKYAEVLNALDEMQESFVYVELSGPRAPAATNTGDRSRGSA